MALTEYEERVIAELEAQLRSDDGVRERCDTIPTRMPRRRIGRRAPVLVSFLAGVALLVPVRHAWFLVRVSNVSGFSSASITGAAGVVGCLLVLGSAVMLWRVVRGQPFNAPSRQRHDAG